MKQPIYPGLLLLSALVCTPARPISKLSRTYFSIQVTAVWIAIYIRITRRFFYLHSGIIELLLLVQQIDIIQEAFRMQMDLFKAELAARQSVAEEYVDYSIAMRTGVMTLGVTVAVAIGTPV